MTTTPGTAPEANADLGAGTSSDEAPARESGRHPVEVGYLVMGIALLGLVAIWALIRRANQYLEERKPWSLAKSPESAADLDTTLWTAAEATRISAILLAPYMPSTSDRIMEQLGLDPVAPGDWLARTGWGSASFGQVNPQGPLFPRIETSPA